MTRALRPLVLLAMLALCWAAPAGAQPTGTVTVAAHITLATRWLDPAETDSEITPFMIFYALHDALVKPMPGALNSPSLAESWSMSKDGRTWEFVLRKGARFHNGDPVTAEDVKFSFERYRGAAAPILKDRVRDVQVVDPGRVRFHLKDPWPDFMTFYGTSASGAAWIVPKKYFERVGEDGFRKAPVGAGPYKFVSFQPGIELTLEAFDGYWRKTPSVKRLVIRSIPEESTRAAALKRGEVDIAYFLNGPVAEDVRRTPGLTLTAMRTNGVLFLMFPEQWTAGSPWADRRVRLAASLSDRPPGDQRGRVARLLRAHRQHRAPAPGVRPADRGRSLRPEAREGAAGRGRLPQRLRRGRVHAVPALQLDGRGHRQLLRGGRHPDARAHDGARRAALRLARQEAAEPLRGRHRLRGQRLHPHRGHSRPRRACSPTARIPELETLFQAQLQEMDRKKREEMLHQIQRAIQERVMFAPIWENGFIRAYGPRMEEAALSLIPSFPYAGPLEDLRLKAR